MNFITIELDEQTMRVPAGSNLADLLGLLDLAPASMATARNGQFVRREARAHTRLDDGDRVLLFKPIVGG